MKSNLSEKTQVKTPPVLYKGWIIKKVHTKQGERLAAYNFKTDIFINPLYNSWELLQLVIDATK